MLPLLAVEADDGRSISLQAFRHRAPLVLVMVHSLRCLDCQPALEAAAAACEEFPDLKAIVLSEQREAICPNWAVLTAGGMPRVLQRLWSEAPSPPVLVLADRYAAVRRVLLPGAFGSLVEEVRLLEHECPE